MTERSTDALEPRLDPWMEARVEQAITPADESIPRDLMWARVAAAPRLVDVSASATSTAMTSAAVPVAPRIASRPSRTRWAVPLLIAAGMLVGVGIGRFGWPRAAEAPVVRTETASAPAAEPPALADAASASTAAPAPTPDSPSAPRALGMAMTPAVAGHLQRTVAVLASVRDAEHVADGDTATREQLQQLLTTTRELLDDPSLRRARTHRLLQDLELVLAQLTRARATAPATRAAADETLRETNLLPRLRAAANDGRSGSEDL